MDKQAYIDLINNFDLNPKPFESRKKFFPRVKKELKELSQLSSSVEYDDEEEMGNIQSGISILNYIIEQNTYYGHCDYCLKFTSTYRGAEYNSRIEYGMTEESFICPKCQKKIEKGLL